MTEFVFTSGSVELLIIHLTSLLVQCLQADPLDRLGAKFLMESVYIPKLAKARVCFFSHLFGIFTSGTGCYRIHHELKLAESHCTVEYGSTHSRRG